MATLRWRVILLQYALASVLLCSGCAAVDEATFGDSADVPPERVTELDRRLAELPSLEETLDDYRALREEIIERTQEIAPELRWRSAAVPGDRYPDYRQSCSGEWVDTRGMVVQLDARVSDVPISDAKWLRVLAVTRAARRRWG